MSIHDAAPTCAAIAASGAFKKTAAGKELRSDGKILRVCAGLSLLLVLVAWFDVSAILHKLFAIDARFVMLAIAIFMLQYILSCIRWVFILGRQNAAIGPRNALSIFGIGTLANLFLVTSLAGMSVRAALLLRAGAGWSGALAPIAAERIAAIAGLGICGIAGAAFVLPELQLLFGARADVHAAMLLAGAFALLTGVTAVLFRKLERLKNFGHQLWLAFSSPRQAILLISISACIVLLGFAGMAALASGMGLAIDPIFYLSVMPAIALISAMPISVGGWGVREGAMVAGLSIFSVPADTAMALSISYGLGGLLVAVLLGALLSLAGNEPVKAKRG